jgi:hypothetical protein
MRPPGPLPLLFLFIEKQTPTTIMIKYTLFALVALFSCFVYAQVQIVTITAPLQNATYTAGQKLVIAW